MRGGLRQEGEWGQVFYAAMLRARSDPEIREVVGCEDGRKLEARTRRGGKPALFGRLQTRCGGGSGAARREYRLVGGGYYGDEAVAEIADTTAQSLFRSKLPARFEYTVDCGLRKAWLCGFSCWCGSLSACPVSLVCQATGRVRPPMYGFF